MIKFILAEMTYLKYFMPLVIEANKRGIRSQMLVGQNNKYNNPQKYLGCLSKIFESHNVKMVELTEKNMQDGLFFTVEGACADKINGKTISLVAMTDFNVFYKRYIDSVDNVIFQSEFFACEYGAISDKNMYMGSPKYDIGYDKHQVRDKYGITGNKVALVLFPRYRDLTLNNGQMAQYLLKTYGYLENLGYEVILKTRGKEPASKNLRPKYYFEDEGWYPHPSLELMSISDFIVNYDSTAIEEAVMLDCPIVNFKIKPCREYLMDFLYNYRYCSELRIGTSFEEFKSSVDFLTTTDLSGEFAKARKNHLFEKGDVSSKILDAVNEI